MRRRDREKMVKTYHIGQWSVKNSGTKSTGDFPRLVHHSAGGVSSQATAEVNKRGKWWKEEDGGSAETPPERILDTQSAGTRRADPPGAITNFSLRRRDRSSLTTTLTLSLALNCSFLLLLSRFSPSPSPSPSLFVIALFTSIPIPLPLDSLFSLFL